MKEFLSPSRFEPWSPGHKADIKPMCYHASLCLTKFFKLSLMGMFFSFLKNWINKTFFSVSSCLQEQPGEFESYQSNCLTDQLLSEELAELFVLDAKFVNWSHSILNELFFFELPLYRWDLNNECVLYSDRGCVSIIQIICYSSHNLNNRHFFLLIPWSGLF